MVRIGGIGTCESFEVSRYGLVSNILKYIEPIYDWAIASH